MQPRKAFVFALLLSCLVLAMTSIASAGYTAVISYGDSLSDNGNLFAATGQPPSPYFMGRFSNGQVAVEYLATSLHAPLHDFAWGGATTGVGNYGDGGTQTSFGTHGLPGMIPQVLGSIGSLTSIAPTSLFVVWGGPNDFLTNGFSTATADTAVADLVGIITDLQAQGAQHILVPGMPDLGLTPDYHGNTSATLLSLYFNHELVTLLPHGATYFDTFAFMHEVEANAASYGFDHLATPCFDGVTVCSTPNTYLFWDGFHPTTYADSLLAAQFEKAVVPEPSTFLMLGTGLAGLAGVLRRKLAA